MISSLAVRGNIDIPDLPLDEEVWLMVSVLSVHTGRTRVGKPYVDAVARNASGQLALKLWDDAIDPERPLSQGLWGIQGKASVYQDQLQFVVSRYSPITAAKYREHQRSEPQFARAFTLDIETLARPEFRARVPHALERDLRLGKMRIEQLERYVEDPEAEVERVYALGSLAATTGRIVCIAVQVAPTPEFGGEGIEPVEHVFGIDPAGREVPERDALEGFAVLVADFDRETDELVGHNVIDFDLPFILQRCIVHGLRAPRMIGLGEYAPRGVYDTMRYWHFGARRAVSLDDVAWALGLQSSKTEEVEGSRVFELYHAGRLAEIREYNLNDVRLTRKIYERLVACYGR